MRKIFRIVINILIVIFVILFLLSLLYFINGSQEMNPTEEQQAKVKEVMGLFMFIFGILSITCLGIRIKLRDKVSRATSKLYDNGDKADLLS